MRFLDIIRPVLVHFPRPGMVILKRLGGGWDKETEWADVEPRYVSYFDRVLNCIVSADLAEWGGRSCYYWGRFGDITHQAVLRRFLKPGWTYVDVGANVGFHSMLAARLVDENGQVYSFEPNPSTYSVLGSHIAINRLQNVRTFPMALSDENSELVLAQTTLHSGCATLRQVERAMKAAKVTVRVGDDVLRDVEFTGPTFLKVDVEGFELQVLRGLRKTLERVDLANVEVTPKWIAAQGGSAGELFTLMKEAGFVALEPQLHWTAKLFFPRLKLPPLPSPREGQHDVLFVRPVYLEPAFENQELVGISSISSNPELEEK